MGGVAWFWLCCKMTAGDADEGPPRQGLKSQAFAAINVWPLRLTSPTCQRASGIAEFVRRARVTTWTAVMKRPCGPDEQRADQTRVRSDVRGALWRLTPRQPQACASPATVVESLGQTWLFTIAEVGWRPTGGKRVAESGPLPIKAETSYTAVYMEAISDPGMTAAIHQHSGPELFYTVTGETCLETPEGMLVGPSEGPAIIVPAGPPMLLTATGASRRRAVVLILHDSSQPATTMVSDWTPKGLCGRCV